MDLTTAHAVAGLSDDAACCWQTPPEFVRPRFFFGQRLGAVDLCDWLWYHAGKGRFHNLRLHGVGMICGLGAERFEIPQQNATTVLRVGRGSALDACGREVAVGVDQCIDVAAWFLQNRERPELVEWLAGDDRRLCVGLRYRECPSDPAPAPRDPCGCDAGGCEFARVREGFELRLFTPAGLAALAPAPPAATAVADLALRLLATEEEATEPRQRAALERRLHRLVADDCPLPPDNFWLWLACFEVTLDEEEGQIVDIGAADNAVPGRLSLLGTAALQELVLALIAAGVEAGALGPGPRFAGLGFEGTAADAGRLRLAIELVPDPSGPAPMPLNGATFDASHVRVRRLDSAAGWTNADPDTAAGDLVEYRIDPEPHLFVEWQGGLQEGHHTVTVAAPPEAPIVDGEARPLRPLPYIRRFRLVLDGTGTLILAPASD